MPDLPLVPNNTNDSHVRSKRRRLSNGEAITCSNTLRSISGDAGIRDMEMVLQFTDNTELRFQNISTNITEYARTMANHLNVNYIEAAPATSLIKSILQNNELDSYQCNIKLSGQYSFQMVIVDMTFYTQKHFYSCLLVSLRIETDQ